jgi:hypothetical protein
MTWGLWQFMERGLLVLGMVFLLEGMKIAPLNATVDLPFQVSTDLFDLEANDTAGLVFAPGVETFTVFAPMDGENFYNHGAVITEYKGRLYVQWQSSERDEDSPDTAVYYAMGNSPTDFNAPVLLAGPREGATITNGGWWVNGDTLVAFLNVWPERNDGPRTGYTEYITSTDGVNWSAPQPVTDGNGIPVKGVIEQDPRALSSGRIVGAFHVEPGLTVSPYYTDDPRGVSGWTRGKMENLGREGDASRAIEPSLFERRDGAIVMVFRDQRSSFKTLSSISYDHGVSWTKPVLIDFPDSRSKQSAGNLPDGSNFRVNNPSNSRARYPLAVSLSRDGRLFDRAFLLRAGGADMQPQRREGRYKRSGYSYPKSAVIGDYLYVAYATNKEDIEIIRVPWRALVSK